MAEKYAEVDPLQFEDSRIENRSVEYCSYILEAVTTGTPFRFMGNVATTASSPTCRPAAASRCRRSRTTPASTRRRSARCRRSAPPPA
jgi:hypothetical protein